MESTTEPIVWYDIVYEVSDTHNRFKLANIPAWFWIDCPDLSSGDRVKITITKEPTDAIPR